MEVNREALPDGCEIKVRAGADKVKRISGHLFREIDIERMVEVDSPHGFEGLVQHRDSDRRRDRHKSPIVLRRPERFDDRIRGKGSLLDQLVADRLWCQRG